MEDGVWAETEESKARKAMRDCVRMMARDKIAGYGQKPDTGTEYVCDWLVPVQGLLSMLNFNNNTSGSISLNNNKSEKRPSTAKQQ